MGRLIHGFALVKPTLWAGLTATFGIGWVAGDVLGCLWVLLAFLTGRAFCWGSWVALEAILVGTLLRTVALTAFTKSLEGQFLAACPGCLHRKQVCRRGHCFKGCPGIAPHCRHLLCRGALRLLDGKLLVRDVRLSNVEVTWAGALLTSFKVMSTFPGVTTC